LHWWDERAIHTLVTSSFDQPPPLGLVLVFVSSVHRLQRASWAVLAVHIEPMEVGIGFHAESIRENETHEGLMDAISKPMDQPLLSPPLSAMSPRHEQQEQLTEGIATRRSNHPLSDLQH